MKTFRALTDEEHEARAMLLGMCYHHGNGEPFYYKQNGGLVGTVDVMSMMDANTLEPLADNTQGHPLQVHDEIFIPSERVFGAYKDALMVEMNRRAVQEISVS